jgi:hypothetical protein
MKDEKRVTPAEAFAYPLITAVAQNPFRNTAAPAVAWCSFEEARPFLPVPVLPHQPIWVKMYWQAWEMAWGKLTSPTAVSGLPAPYLNVAGDHKLYMWDTALMTQFGVYGRQAFDFITLLDNFYANQERDGFIGRVINGDSGLTMSNAFHPDSTGPNLFAWAEWRTYRMSGDDARLTAVFWPLLALYSWYRANRTWPDGLYWATGASSGMDNQIRVPGGEHHHQHWSWVDASMQAAVNAHALQQIALALGHKELAQALAADRANLHSEINLRLWNRESHFYQDRSPQNGFSDVKSLSAYWGLLDKELVPQNRLESFLRHVRDADKFRRGHPLPSISADSPGYNRDNGNMWRGGVWPPLNFAVLKGLRMVNQHALAYQIAFSHLQRVATVYQNSATFWDHYAPETAWPGAHARRDFTGWTALTPIAILLEDVLGIMTDWPQRRVMWDLRLPLPPEEAFMGVENYPLGNEESIDLLTNGRKLVVTTAVPFTLTLRTPEMTLQKAIAVGTTEIDLD